MHKLKLTFFILIVLIQFGNLYSQDTQIKIKIFSLIESKIADISSKDLLEVNLWGNNADSTLQAKNVKITSEKLIIDHSIIPVNKQNLTIEIKTKTDFIKIGNQIIPPRNYRGTIQVQIKNDKLFCYNILNIEEYLYSVVYCEIYNIAKNNIESLKSQAIVSRTYAYKNMHRSKVKDYDFPDSTQAQVYKGADFESWETIEAVNSTKGLVIKNNGILADAFYHSTCGGHTSDISQVFNTDDHSLIGIKDEIDGKILCEKSPHYFWRAFVSKDIIIDTFFGNKINNELVILVREKDYLGRIIEIELIHNAQNVIISGETFRIYLGRIIGWNKIKSSKFSFQEAKDKFILTGYGLGHGIGLCQYGSVEMAKLGYNYEEIIKHYFPKCYIGKI